MKSAGQEEFLSKHYSLSNLIIFIRHMVIKFLLQTVFLAFDERFLGRMFKHGKLRLIAKITCTKPKEITVINILVCANDFNQNSSRSAGKTFSSVLK